MYIEDVKKKTAGLEIRQWNAIKWAVFHEKAGCVFMGKLEQCYEYLHNERRRFNEGRSPEFDH